MSKKLNPPVARFIGFRLIKAGKGKAVCGMRVKKHHVYSNGAVCGGILCDLADSTMGFAFMALLPDGQTGVTVEFKISFFKPVYPSDELKATARILSHGRTLYFLECEVRDSKRRLVAKAASTCKILPATR